MKSDIAIKGVAAIPVNAVPLNSISEFLSTCDKINRNTLLA